MDRENERERERIRECERVQMGKQVRQMETSHSKRGEIMILSYRICSCGSFIDRQGGEGCLSKKGSVGVRREDRGNCGCSCQWKADTARKAGLESERGWRVKAQRGEEQREEDGRRRGQETSTKRMNERTQ